MSLITLNGILLANNNNKLILQQDGTLAHNAFVERNYLNENFKSRQILTNGLVKWPP